MRKLKTEGIFLILYVLYIINQILSESQFINIDVMDQLLTLSRYAILGLLIMFIISKNKMHGKRKIVLILVLAFFLIINLIFKNGGLSYLPIVLFVLATQDLSVQKIWTITIWTLSLMTIFVMLCAKLGIVKDMINLRYIGDNTGAFFSGSYVRHNMGFLVHNQIALTFLIIYLLIIAYKRDKIRWYENLLFMVLNFIVFNYFGSRIVFIITVLTCVAFYAIKFLKKSTLRNLANIWMLSYPLLAIASFGVALTYNSSNQISLMLNLFFNNRLRFAKEAIDFYGINILGAGKFAGTYNSTVLAENNVDNGYIALFLQNGIVIACIVIGFWMYLTYVAAKKGNAYLTLALVVLAVENLLNSYLGSYKVLPFFCILLNQQDPFVEGEIMYHVHRKKLKHKRVKLTFGKTH